MTKLTITKLFRTCPSGRRVWNFKFSICLPTVTLVKAGLLFVICSLLFPIEALAQSAMGLTAIPPRLEITINPGQVITQEIKIRNESQTTRFLTTNVKDFIVQNDKGTPIQLEDVGLDNRWAAASWVQVSPTQIRLKPGETKGLSITIIAPENASPGGHYAMVIHSPDKSSTLDGTGMAVQANVGSLLYITVPGEIQEAAKVQLFEAPFFSEFGPIDFKTIVTNLSDIHISPIGNIEVTNFLGSKTAILPLEKINIFPFTSRNYQNTLNRKWLFGRYRASLLAGFGSQGQALSAYLYFWVIPWRLILLIITAITILIILLSLLKKASDPKNRKNQVQSLEKELRDLKKKYQDR